MWDLAWVTDPAAWAGLGTLVLLEVVLGVDNLVFISILVNKLPQEKKRQAFMTGLGLALLMRMVLLAFMARLVALTDPLFTLGGTAILPAILSLWLAACSCCSRAQWNCTTGLKAMRAGSIPAGRRLATGR